MGPLLHKIFCCDMFINIHILSLFGGRLRRVYLFSDCRLLVGFASSLLGAGTPIPPVPPLNHE